MWRRRTTSTSIPATLRLITQNIRLVDRLRTDPEANRLFMEMMTSQHDPETTLRRLNEAGVFGRFVPDFGRVVAQTQHDMYHTYTVDEHTIRAIGILSRIENGTLKEDHPLSADVVHKILSRPVLYLAVLLHDIAKGRGGDHSVLGADVAMQLGPRLGLSAAETETVAWLVRYHLAMSGTAFQRDLMDPKTIDTFAALVQSPERLRLLLVLTVCDIRAVGPNVWNGWKAALLRQLYHATEQVLSGGTLSGGRGERIKQIQGEVAKRLASWTEAEKEEHFARGYAPYWLSFDPDTLARQAELVRARRARAPAARHRAPHRRRALGHRGHDLHARHPRPVRPPRRRHGDQRRQHRRRQDLHPGQRHGARHVLDPGPRGQAVRRPAAPGAARRPRRDRALQPPRHPARARQPALVVAQARPRLHRRAARADRQQRLATRSP